MKKFFIISLIAVTFASLAFAQAAPDPVRISTGARPLGMGKAFVGLADDIGSVFLNPSGIANANRWQITSMSGKLLEEFNYLSLSGLYPSNFGNFGVAYVGSSIGGALPTTIEAGSDPDDPVYIVDQQSLAEGGEMSYSNNLIILSYGDKLKRILDTPIFNFVNERLPDLKNANFGLNLKLFSVQLSGDHISGGNASGMDMDFGIQGKPQPWLSLGANLQNALPASMGGKLHYDSGWDESYPAVLKLGAAIDVVGPANALRKIDQHRITLLADVDHEVSRSDKIPNIFHLGVEWKPLELIAIRSGIDQEMVGPGEIANNFTSGVGLYYGDFRFDVAYHQFAGAPGVNNMFFSLTYGITPQIEREKLISAPDKLITTNMVETVKGLAVDPRIILVRVNGINVKVSPRGEYQTQVSLTVGKNKILVEGIDGDGKLVEADKLRILRLLTYPDVPKEYWGFDQVNYIGTLGIIKGYPNGNFKPEGNITRAELSTLLIRTKMGKDELVPVASSEVFRDVPLKHWAAKYINLAAGSKIVTGYPDKSFKPQANISRAEGLAMIARFGGVKELTLTGKEFTDMNAKHWAAPIIAGAYKEGMLIFLKGKPFEANRSLTRSEAVEMLYRSGPIVNLVKDLQNFDKGY